MAATDVVVLISQRCGTLWPYGRRLTARFGVRQTAPPRWPAHCATPTQLPCNRRAVWPSKCVIFHYSTWQTQMESLPTRGRLLALQSTMR
jgi:hypothetical protein